MREGPNPCLAWDLARFLFCSSSRFSSDGDVERNSGYVPFSTDSATTADALIRPGSHPRHHVDVDETYVRLHADYRGRLEVEVGIFVAVDHLRRADILSVEEEETYFDIDDWFNLHLPNPPFYDDGNAIQAVTWFKRSTTADMLGRLEPLQRILSKHGVACHLTETEDPGQIVYEDQFQVGAIPRVRGTGRPFPYGDLRGVTGPGPKRQFGKAARTAHRDVSVALHAPGTS